MSTNNVEDIYTLTPMQQGMLYHSILAPGSGTYCEQSAWTLTGPLHTAAFRQAWQQVLNRHAALRAGFVWEGLDEPVQVIYRDLDLPFCEEDWTALAPDRQEREMAAFLEQDRAQGFDFANPPLMRMALIRLAENRWTFVWTHHHLLLDGWSQPLILKDFFLSYDAYARGQRPMLPPAAPYRNYIAWLKRQDRSRAEAIWRAEMAGYTAAPTLDVAFPQPVGTEYAYAKRQVRRETGLALQRLARERGITLNTIMQAAWALLLSRYSREEDIVFGATVSGRPPSLPGADSLVGLLINTLPVRIQVTPQTPVIEWLRGIQNHQAGLREYEYTSLIDIQSWSDVPRGTPLFNALLVFENYPANPMEAGRLGDLEIQAHMPFSRTNYPLTLAVSPTDPIGLLIAYETAQFDEATVERMLGHLETLLEGMLRFPEKPIGELPLITAEEQRQLTGEWAETPSAADLAQTVLDLIAAQVRERPGAPALRFEGAQLTYAELDARSNQLAHHLLACGLRPGQIAGLCLPPSLDLPVTILAIQKAGAAYLPLDPSYPLERLAFMIEDSGLSVLVTHSALLETLPQGAGGAGVLFLDLAQAEIERQPRTAPAVTVTPDDLAYVIYTSGSTGQPKGSPIQHRALSNLAQNGSAVLGYAPGKRLLQFYSISFDASVWEVFCPLVSGATLVLGPREVVTSPADLTALANREEITHLASVPAFLALLDPADLPSVEVVFTGGEHLPVELARRWASKRYINAYGPTEAAVVSTVYVTNELPAGARRTPIGRPLGNTRAYIADDHLLPLPLGVAGELLLGGVSLSPGYHNRPELTAQKFIADPFRPGERVYRTGDLARWLPDGNIEILGRIDDQVKIRGFRIEPGEIEAVLLEHHAARHAAVIATPDADGEKRLVAFAVPEPDTELTGDALVESFLEHLKSRLPAYMLPNPIVLLDAMPLTPSGKIDRRRLPVPELGAPAAAYGETTAMPHTMVQQGLAEIWQQVLHVQRVSLNDDFFALGGHSLRAAQLASRINEIFLVDLPIRELFGCPTLSAMAARVETLIQQGGESESAVPALRPAVTQGPVPLSFAQQRLWFLDQLVPGSLLYNQPLAVRMQGQLDLDALHASLNEIVRRHAVLRTRFREQGGQPFQDILPGLTIAMPLVDLSSLPADQVEAEAARTIQDEVRKGFDLSTGPLLRALVVRLSEQDHIALLVMHHIISDGWSLGVLLNEISQLYTAQTTGQPARLPDLPVQYSDYAVWQRDWLQGTVRDSQLAYWKEQLEGMPPMLELPTDHPRPAVQSSRGSIYPFELPAELSEQLAGLSQEEGVTLYMTLLAAFDVLLARYAGQDDIMVGTAVANRGRTEIEGLIGFFVNTLVLRARLGEQLTFRDLLQQVRETCLGAYSHQDLPFEYLVEALQPERNLSHTPLFQVMFTMDPPLDATISLPGLNMTPFQAHPGAATFDLTLSISPAADTLRGSVEYNTDLWEESTIRRMVEHFQVLLAAAVEDPDSLIWTMPMLTAEEEERLLEGWNQTTAPAPLDRTAHELFEEQARIRPDAPALYFQEQVVSYAELNRRANQLAHYLHKRGVKAETLVAISTTRSVEMIVGILGVLKAGGAYLPLDPAYPPDRLAFMLEDSQAPLLLTLSTIADALPKPAGETILLDQDWETIALEPDENLPRQSGPHNLAYVIYTSGSTGKPKGAQLEHHGVCNLAEAQKHAFDMGEGCRELQFSPFSFDASVWETFMALANGGALVLAPQEILASVDDLLKLLQQRQVTHVTLPPSVLQVLPQSELPDLRVVIAAGEACPAELVARWAPGRKFFNAYGPTETTVCASMHLCSAEEGGPPPIGRPLPNFRLYVCDRQMGLTPTGVPGELLVSGAGLARGYLNRPEMTAEKFIDNPFRPEDSNGLFDRAYRTGDLVRWRPTPDGLGVIEFLGRIDQQVKVRGFRIELGEIESALLQHPQVQHAAVIPHTTRGGSKLTDRLIAYLVLKPEAGELDSAALADFLRQTLPDYMIPHAFITLESLPISPSGKIDRRRLAALEVTRDEPRVYVAPRSEREAKLAEMCAALLNLEQVGVTENFFDLGGHSLLATQFVSHIREAFQVELPLRSLFEHPTVAGLAEEIDRLALQKAAAPAATAIPRASREQYRQKRTEGK